MNDLSQKITCVVRFSEMYFPRRALERTPKIECMGWCWGLGFGVYIYIYIYIYIYPIIYIYIYISKNTMGVVQTRGVLIIGQLL